MLAIAWWSFEADGTSDPSSNLAMNIVPGFVKRRHETSA